MSLSKSLLCQLSDWASNNHDQYEADFLNFYKVKYQQYQAHEYTTHQKPAKDIISIL